MRRQNPKSVRFRVSLFATLFVLLFLAVSAGAAPAVTPAQGEPAASPILVVWARTNLANQGARTLDLSDLERYFVEQLTSRHIENVVRSATAQNSRPPDPRIYILEVSVDAMLASVRSKWGEHHYYEDQPIFHVELSLTVKHPASGRTLGNTGERRDYELSFSNLEENAPKRGVLYDAADHLVDRFLDEARAGKFGDGLTSIQTPDAWTNALVWAKQPLTLLSAVFSGVAVFFTFASFSLWSIRRREEADRKRAMHARWDARLTEAKAKALETNNFSEEWVLAAARCRRETILNESSAIEGDEAKRQVTARAKEAEYRVIASYAAEVHGLNAEETVELLRQADLLPYRLLVEAKNLTEGRV